MDVQTGASLSEGCLTTSIEINNVHTFDPGILKIFYFYSQLWISLITVVSVLFAVLKN